MKSRRICSRCHGIPSFAADRRDGDGCQDFALKMQAILQPTASVNPLGRVSIKTWQSLPRASLSSAHTSWVHLASPPSPPSCTSPKNQLSQRQTMHHRAPLPSTPRLQQPRLLEHPATLRPQRKETRESRRTPRSGLGQGQGPAAMAVVPPGRAGHGVFPARAASFHVEFP